MAQSEEDSVTACEANVYNKWSIAFQVLMGSGFLGYLLTRDNFEGESTSRNCIIGTVGFLSKFIGALSFFVQFGYSCWFSKNC